MRDVRSLRPFDPSRDPQFDQLYLDLELKCRCSSERSMRSARNDILEISQLAGFSLSLSLAHLNSRANVLRMFLLAE